jgi:hypothetical protein
MLRHHKYRPYIRRMNGKEKSDDIFIAMRLAFYRKMIKKGEKVYVCVQTGFPNNAIMIGKTKEEIKNRILVVRIRKWSFKKWAKAIQEWAK